VSGAYKIAIESVHTPSVLALSRQSLPQLPGTSIEGVARGGYTIVDVADPQLVLVGTGSEVQLCVKAAAALSDLRVRVVSMPCTELFDQQSADYRASVLGTNVPVLSVEAGSPTGWSKYSHVHHGMSTFGASGPLNDVLAHFGFTPDAVAAKARAVHAHYSGRVVPNLLDRPTL
jgi:transketolase